MDAAPSAPNPDNASASWHPAMRPNAHRSNDADGKQMDQSPLHSADNIYQTEPSKRPPDDLKIAGQTESQMPLPLEENDESITSAQRTGQSDIRADCDAIDSTSDGNGQAEHTEEQRPGPFEGALGNDPAVAGPENSLPESYSISGPSEDAQLRAVLQEEDCADTERAALTGPVPNLSHTVNGLGSKDEMAKAWHSEPGYEEDLRPEDASRTNSFPQVPPLGQTRGIPLHTLPHSQVEDIMEEDKTVGSRHHLPSSESLAATSTSSGAQEQLVETTTGGNEGLVANLDTTHAADPALQADEESRYEEGLPLMPAPEHLPMRVEPRSPDARKYSDTEDGGDGFFDKMSRPLSDEASSFRPQALDRKSTRQVLDALHYASHSATHGDAYNTQEEQLLPAQLGGTPLSSSSSNSQVYAEQQMKTTNTESKDEDLAEIWKAALGDDEFLEEHNDSLDPSSFFEDDGEGFLEGGEDQGEDPLQTFSSLPALEPIHGSDGSMQGRDQVNSRQSSSRDKYLPDSTSQSFAVPPMSGYAHPGGAPVSAPNRFADTNRQHDYAAQPPASRPPMPPSTQSFADKSKGGYTSPYDLPMDITRPKKRVVHQQLHPNSDVQVAPVRPPPPRSSSMFTGAYPSLDTQPPVPRLPSAASSISTGNGLPNVLKASPSKATFFEELPSSKPRPSSSMGRAAQSIPQSTPPPSASFQRDPLGQAPMAQRPSSGSPNASQQYQLLPPERMSLYANASQSEPKSQTLPVANTRYSPAPVQQVQQSNVPPPRNRYAASPPIVGRPVPSQTLSFQPRTSSPLAQNSSLTRANHQPSLSDPPLYQPTSGGRQAVQAHDSVSQRSYLNQQIANVVEANVKQDESTRAIESNLQSGASPHPLPPTNHATLSNPPSDSSYAMNTPDADHRSSDGSTSFQPHESPMNAYGATTHGLPLRRSQSQSPDTGKYKPELLQSTQNQYQRPASVNNNHVALSSADTRAPLSYIRQREITFSNDLNYIKPSDGREMDFLERWKGCPIINFGFGGKIVTSFPKHVPRYAAGQSTPMIKCSSGEVKIQDGKILPLTEDVATFPGPLRSKGKKKEILDWLQRRISHLENDGVGETSSATLPDPRKRHGEKMLLWKIVRVLVEYDGAVDGNASAENTIRSILSPELTVGDNASLAPRSFDSPLLGISRDSNSRSIRDPVKPETMEVLRKLLLHGEREKAVWHAVDHHLWAHAMLLASTLEKNVWRQVSQEFVRQEVKTFGHNTESLAALYQIFAGNWDESMDELVPPSARAGLQLISKTATTGPTKNALDGLDRWQETMTLILSNRSVDDGRALVSLGQLLASYGRIEAAHICYIFAKSPGLFGGPDDSHVNVALLGADHLQRAFDYGRDLDCILLTEVYDFALTVLAPSSAATVSPHLQSYKLYHAMILAEHGYKVEAQQYCEAITSTLNSTTKRSPYYHNLLFGALEDLVDRLRQAPRDSSGSWISKPSIDKVSGSIWAKFNQYVAGDESDAASTASGKALEQDVGPFARVAGESPDLSRTPSSTDMYSSYATGLGASQLAPTSNPSNSRYAPAGLYTPRSSVEQPGNSSQDFQRPAQIQKDSLRPGLAPQQYQSRPVSSNGSYTESYKPTSQPSNYPPRTESYLPTPPSQPEYMPVAPPEDPSSTLYQQDYYHPTAPVKSQLPREQHQSSPQSEPARDYQPSSITYGPPSYTYEHPSTSSYEPPPMDSYNPPSYDPDVPQAEESPVEEKPKKRSFMDDDDDDDFEARATALRKEEKARKDREADEAFKRAVEADGMYYQSFESGIIWLTLRQRGKTMLPSSTLRSLDGSVAGWAARKRVMLVKLMARQMHPSKLSLAKKVPSTTIQKRKDGSTRRILTGAL